MSNTTKTIYYDFPSKSSIEETRIAEYEPKKVEILGKPKNAKERRSLGLCRICSEPAASSGRAMNDAHAKYLMSTDTRYKDYTLAQFKTETLCEACKLKAWNRKQDIAFGRA